MALELDADFESLTHPSSPIAGEGVLETEQPDNNPSPASAEQPSKKSLVFLDEEPAEASTLLGQMEQAAAASQDDQPTALLEQSDERQDRVRTGASANLAESQTDAIRKITNTFDEEAFLAAMLPEKAQQAHASSLNEEEVHIFVNDIVRSAGNRHRKLGELLKLSKSYVLRDRAFYNKQGQHNSQGKTWTDRKKQ